MSLVASAKLHKLDPGLYLREVIRGLPHWPKDRDLELSPRHWAATRARLSVRQLAQDGREVHLHPKRSRDSGQ